MLEEAIYIVRSSNTSLGLGDGPLLINLLPDAALQDVRSTTEVIMWRCVKKCNCDGVSQ